MPGKYSRKPLWRFAGKLSLKVADALAPMAYRDAVRLDPLKSYVETVASAHMLAWLHAAFSHGVEVESYLDAAEGVPSILPDRRSWVSEVTLKPGITFHPSQEVEAKVIERFHELALQDCFIARSIKTKVTVSAP
ncbi:OsmC/Ohr family protein [mine drainage metagenome]|uniref:OsmC/Ohr family protein n=1 Tax=mine drainage metagenome TaxID=410659 RepID=T0XXW6_9ZZZZ